MARQGHQRSGRRKQMAEINVVPYIDVMLVLLVIFMVTAPLMTVGTKANLPGSRYAEPLEDLNNPDIKPFFLIVQKGGRLQWQIASGKANDLTLDQLKLKVPVAKAVPNSKIFVYGDESVPYGEMIAAFDLLRDAGHGELNLALEDPREMNSGGRK